MYRARGTSLMAAGVCLLLGAVPGWAGPPNNDLSDDRQNTAGGTGALVNNTAGDKFHAGDNTAFGYATLYSNTKGASNTAFGALALRSNTTGGANSAFGEGALQSNTTGHSNTAVGHAALFSNEGDVNTAVGRAALRGNTRGNGNTAVGSGALFSNTMGIDNAAVGNNALGNNRTGARNTAVGDAALFLNIAGSNNTALGFGAGYNLTSGSDNIYLGNPGAATESNTTRLGQNQTRTFIAGIAGTQVSGTQVVVTGSGQLGTLVSAARYKRNIRTMGDRSRGLFALRPVTYRYKQDPQGVRQYGLIAEEVAKVYPELVTRRSDGAVESVQYHELIPMLLNELQRQQRTLNAQAWQIADLKAGNQKLQTALAEQNARIAARLTKLEMAGRKAATLASH